MEVIDYIYKTTYNGCLRLGVKPGQAANAASIAVENYKKGKRLNSGGVSKMIASVINDAKRAK